MAVTEKSATPPGAVRFMAHFIRAYPARSALMMGLLAVAGLAEGVGVVTLLPLLELATLPEGGGEPSAAGRVVENLLGTVGLSTSLGTLLALIVLAMTAKAFLLWMAMRQVGYTVAQVMTDLRMSLLRALLSARWRYFTSQSAGRFANSMSGETTRAVAAYREGCVLAAGIVQVAVYFAAALLIAWQLAIAAVAAGGAFLFLLRRFVRASRTAGEDQTILMRSLIERLTDAIRGMKPIKAMGREGHLRPLLERETEGLNDAMRRSVLASESLRLFHEPALVLLISGGLFFALSVWGLPFASIMVMAFIFYRLMAHVNTLQLRYQIMVQGESAFWSFHEQVNRAQAEVELLGGGKTPPPLSEGIELEDVWFAYDEEPVLRGVSLRIPAGKFVTLFGSSGAGKTTIADLILRLHDPDRGEITVDGVLLDDLDIGAWRRSIGYVPQEMLLFHDSIFRNVTLGDPAITRAEVEEALRLAGAWDFVSARSDGMDATLGEQGALFSGGQRQRIAIARALVHQPKLLILDEVTTALDPETEAAIAGTLRELSGSVTILAISHQTALRDAADIVYRLDSGAVHEVEVPSRESSLPV